MKTKSLYITRSLLVASLLSTGIAWAAAPAAAQSGAPLTTSVRFSDLDLTSARGAELGYRRIAGAAEQVCPPLISSDIHARSRMRGCVRTAIAETVEKINQPALTAYYVTHGDGRAGASVVVASSR
jgi:UrcA family protein